MTLPPWKTMLKTLRRSAAALPAAGAVLGVAMAAGSSVRPDADRTAEAVSRITGGDLGVDGLAAIKARLTPAQLAEAMRHDPNLLQPALYGLTPGWESLTLAGKPGLEPGKSGLEAQRLNAAMAPASGALRPAQPFVFKGSAEDRRRALRCLTQAVYFEAALEPDSGQAGVAQVVLNRVRDPNYANTVCGVVFEGAERTTGCQFSFTCDGSLAQAPVAWAWDRARRVAEKALDGAVAQQVGTATHYHADYVHPWWAPTVAKVTQIGAHIFYRWKGVYGETAAFRQRLQGARARDRRGALLASARHPGRRVRDRRTRSRRPCGGGEGCAPSDGGNRRPAARCRRGQSGRTPPADARRGRRHQRPPDRPGAAESRDARAGRRHDDGGRGSRPADGTEKLACNGLTPRGIEGLTRNAMRPGGRAQEDASLNHPEVDCSRWDEADRLAALRRYGVLDTTPEASFDDLANLAARLCDAPMAAVSLVDAERQWFKAEVGLGVSETPRPTSFCAHAMVSDQPMVVTDAEQDPRFADNPLVTGAPHIRFYAGYPLKTPEGTPLGALCVLDHQARPQGLTELQALALQTLAAQVMTQLELRRALLDRDRSEKTARLAIEASAYVGAWDWDIASDRVVADERFARMYGVDPVAAREGAPIEVFRASVHPDDADRLGEDIQRALDGEGPFVSEYRLVVDGLARWVLARGRVEYDRSGAAVRLPGVAVDITERKQIETDLAETARALSESETRFRVLADAMPQMVWSTQPDGFHDYYNARWYEFTGVPVGSDGRGGLERHLPSRRPATRLDGLAPFAGDGRSL